MVCGERRMSKALPAGWMWRITLSSRTGNGYVYSSAHLSDDAACETLIARSALRKPRTADPRLLNIRVGRRTNFWLRNCVSIGLSSGFVEPLESTGIHLITKAVRLLVEQAQLEGAMLLTVTHDTRLLPLFQRVLRIEGGRLSEESHA